MKERGTKISYKLALNNIMWEAEPLPSDFNEWAFNSFEDTYMYYHKENSKTYYGYCSCGTEGINLTRPRSGSYITCPQCNKRVRLKNDIYSPNNYDTLRLVYLQSTSDGWMQRLFYAYKRTNYDNTRSPRTTQKVDLYEAQRDHLFPQGDYFKFHIISRYKDNQLLEYWGKGRSPKPGMGCNNFPIEEYLLKLYPNNNPAEILKKSEYEYSQIEEASQLLEINPFWWLLAYKDFPQLEYLMKLKLYNVAEKFYYNAIYKRYSYTKDININGKTLKDICGLESKADIAIAAKYNLNVEQIRAYNYVKQWKDVNLEAIDFMVILMNRNFHNSPIISAEKLFAYYKTIDTNNKPSDFIVDYKDYIRAAEYLKMNLKDTKVKTPHDFKHCHDVCLARKQELEERARERSARAEAKKQRQSYKKLFHKYNEELSYKDKKYQIIVPKAPEEIRQEGVMQHNCVGSYLNRILSGCSIILFLRKAKTPDVPFCTVELRPSDYALIQCRASRNAGAPKDAASWMSKYVSRLQREIQNKAASAAANR